MQLMAFMAAMLLTTLLHQKVMGAYHFKHAQHRARWQFIGKSYIRDQAKEVKRIVQALFRGKVQGACTESGWFT